MARRRTDDTATMPAPENVRVLRRGTQELPCTLTPEEFEARAHELGQLVQDIRDEAENQKSEKANMKAKMDEMEARRNVLASVVTRGEENREVSWEEHADDVAGVVRRIRTDSGATVTERPLRDDERQIDFTADED